MALVSTHITLFLYSMKNASKHLLLSYLTTPFHLSWLRSIQWQTPRSIHISLGTKGPGWVYFGDALTSNALWRPLQIKIKCLMSRPRLSLCDFVWVTKPFVKFLLNSVYFFPKSCEESMRLMQTGSSSHTLLKAVKKFLYVFSTFIVWFGWTSA
jgi:hypothetical protein